MDGPRLLKSSLVIWRPRELQRAVLKPNYGLRRKNRECNGTKPLVVIAGQVERYKGAGLWIVHTIPESDVLVL